MELRAHQSAVQDACHDKVSGHPLHELVIFSNDQRDNAVKLFHDAGFRAPLFTCSFRSDRGNGLAFSAFII
jgi:uncharacterized HAD superfamily protein